MLLNMRSKRYTELAWNLTKLGEKSNDMKAGAFLIVVRKEDKNEGKDAIIKQGESLDVAKHNVSVDVKKKMSQEADTLNKVSKLKGKIVVDKVKEQDKNNNVIRGYGWKCNNRNESETTVNPARDRDKVHVA